MDAKDQYMSGRYLVDVEAAIELAALQLAIDFEPFDNRNKALDLIEYVFTYYVLLNELY